MVFQCDSFVRCRYLIESMCNTWAIQLFVPIWYIHTEYFLETLVNDIDRWDNRVT